MKYFIYIGLFGILFMATPCIAQTLIAVQNESSSTFYSSLDLAITNATAGDYIYLPGGSFEITVPINKKLQIVGVGHNPDSCATTGISQVTGNILILNGSDHGSITGLKISGSISFGTSPTDISINYYAIERCNIGSTISLATRSSNILINECVIKGAINGNNTQGFQLSKCIVDGTGIYGFDSNAYFTNNIFNRSYFGSYNHNGASLYITGCFFKNNVFLSKVNENSYDLFSNSLFQNNLFNAGTVISSTNNLFRNNITGPVSTLFKNQSGVLFDYKLDYHILETSPAHNAGTDGTDLGIYGTGNPWKEGSVPSNPHIQSKTISTVNGNLNVKIKVAAQDY